MPRERRGHHSTSMVPMAQHKAPESVSWTPGPKMYAAGGGGGLTVIVAWILQIVGVNLPGVAVAAIAAVLAAIGAYLAPHWTPAPDLRADPDLPLRTFNQPPGATDAAAGEPGNG